MRRVAELVRSIAMVCIGVVIGAGSALAGGAVTLDAGRSLGPQGGLQVEVTNFEIGRDGRSLRSVDLTVHGDLPPASSIRYRLDDAGGWSEECALFRVDGRRLATASGCLAPAGSTAADVTSVTVVVSD